MTLKQNFELMAQYNQWMNDEIYRSLKGLDSVALNQQRGAYFDSISGTLNHILVGDYLWLKRFLNHTSDFESLQTIRSIPAVTALSEILYTDIDNLYQARQQTDSMIIHFVDETTEQDYAHTLHYQNMGGQPVAKCFGYLLQHFFNHQTHHRGQVSTLLNQLNIDVGVTDLLAIIPDVEV